MEASVTRPHQFRPGGLRTSPGSFGDGLVFPPPPRTTSFASPTWVTFIGCQSFLGASLSSFFKASSLLDFNDRSSLSFKHGLEPTIRYSIPPKYDRRFPAGVSPAVRQERGERPVRQ